MEVSGRHLRPPPRAGLGLLLTMLMVFGAGPVLAEPIAQHSPDAPSDEEHASGGGVLAEDPLTNEWCPVLTDERVDPEIHTEFEGATVYLCCQKCLKQFRADPTAYVANLPGAAAADSDQHGVAGADHEHQATETVQGHVDQAGADDHESEEPGHDHADHASGAASGTPGLILWLGRFHPMVVHFPIALLLMAAAAEVLSRLLRSSRLAFAARFCLWGGCLGALLAAPLGWATALGVEGEYTGLAARILFFHRWVGVATAVTAAVALLAGERYWRGGAGASKRIYRVALFSCVLLVTVAGHLGASLIYGWEYLAW